MAIDRAIFAEAVATHLSAGVASRLDAAFKMAPDSPEDTDADAGRALAIAMTDQPVAQVAPQVDRLTLHSVELQSGVPVTLTPRDALSHPLLSEWMAATFSDMLGECVRAGRIIMDAAPSCPVFDLFRLSELDGEVRSGMAVLTFDTKAGQSQVRVIYGEPTVGWGYGKLYQADGDAVYATGRAMRWLGPRGSAPREPAVSPSPDSGALH